MANQRKLPKTEGTQ